MTGSMAQRKNKLPEANKMARMIRTGRTTGDLAVRYGINSNVIIQQLTANGWDASTGEWVGGDKKDYRHGGPLTARGTGAGQSGHHVGGGDNPNVVPTTTRPFQVRHRPTGFAWPAAENPAPDVPAMRPQRRPQNHTTVRQPSRLSKISAEQESELAKRYLDGESSCQLARDYGVNERTIRKRLKNLGVPLRSRTEAQKLRHEQYRAAHNLTLAALASVSKDVSGG